MMFVIHSNSPTLLYREILEFNVKMRNLLVRVPEEQLEPYLIYDTISHILAYAVHEPLKKVYWESLANKIEYVVDEWPNKNSYDEPFFLPLEKELMMGSERLVDLFVNFYNSSNEYSCETPGTVIDIFAEIAPPIYLLSTNIGNIEAYRTIIHPCERIQDFLAGKLEKL